MLKTENIISSLPLVADVLGRKYGVKVHIGGERAYTDGKNIHLPALPLDAGQDTLNLARGYLDHESAHLRITDFEVLKQAKLTGLERHIWNILEDFMVEHKLSDIYPGCAHNLAWLVKRLFLNQDNELSSSPAENVLHWILISVRSFAVPDLVPEKNKLEQIINKAYPKLIDDLEPLMLSVPNICQNTSSCICMAKEIVERIGKYVEEHPEDNKEEENRDENTKQEIQDSQNSDNNAKGGEVENKNEQHSSPDEEKICPKSNNGANKTVCSKESSAETDENCNNPTLKELLTDSSLIPQMDIGEMAGKLLETMGQNCANSTLEVAVPLPSENSPIKAEDIAIIRQKTTALRTRLTALLQSKILCRNFPGRNGKIDTRRIGRLAAADPRIFVRQNEKQGINTVIHILLDASGSMQTHNKIILACHACYAVAEVLHKIRGVSVAVTSFPNGSNFDVETGKASWATVCPILSCKQKFHNKFEVRANGGTPMAAALWWVLQRMQPLTEKRKILLILSDGEPDNLEETLTAFEAHRANGHEVYGIGIASHAIRQITGNRNSKVIYDLQELAGAMFEMLRPVLLGKIGGRYENAS